MFLVRYSRTFFVDAERISHLGIGIGGKVFFNVSGEEEGEYIVEKEFASMLVNHVQALNTNMDSIQSAYVEINKA